MKGYFLILVLVATSWSLSAGASHTSAKKSETLITAMATQLFHEGVIVIYQGLHVTQLDIPDVGTAIGTLLDSTGKVVRTYQFEDSKEITFDHLKFGEGMYEFVLEKESGELLEFVSFEMK